MQYFKVTWSGYSLEDNLWIHAEDISTGILQDLWTKASMYHTILRYLDNSGRPGRYQEDKTLPIIQHKQLHIRSLSREEEEFNTYANNIILQIFDLFH